MAAVRIVQEEIGAEAEVCTHLSLKFNYAQNFDRSLQRVDGLLSGLCDLGQPRVLLVSGGGPKKKFNTCSVLEALAARAGALPNGLVLSAAFNPYLPASEMDTERTRMRDKLATGLVQEVYLQIGTDLQRLREGLEFLRSLESDMGRAPKRQRTLDGAQGGRRGASGPLRLYGSVFLPSKRLLAQMKFRRDRRTSIDSCTSGGCRGTRPGAHTGGRRTSWIRCFCVVEPNQQDAPRSRPNPSRLASRFFPLCLVNRPWNGVFLSDEYLSDVAAAERITKELLGVYSEYGVTPLVETAVRTDAEMAAALRLLDTASSCPDAS